MKLAAILLVVAAVCAWLRPRSITVNPRVHPEGPLDKGSDRELWPLDREPSPVVRRAFCLERDQ